MPVLISAKGKTKPTYSNSEFVRVAAVSRESKRDFHHRSIRGGLGNESREQ